RDEQPVGGARGEPRPPRDVRHGEGGGAGAEAAQDGGGAVDRLHALPSPGGPRSPRRGCGLLVGHRVGYSLRSRTDGPPLTARSHNRSYERGRHVRGMVGHIGPSTPPGSTARRRTTSAASWRSAGTAVPRTSRPWSAT